MNQLADGDPEMKLPSNYNFMKRIVGKKTTTQMSALFKIIQLATKACR